MTLRDSLLVAADYVLTLVWLKATLLILAFALLRLLAGRRSAATRSVLWTLAAAGLLVVPLLQHLLPPAGLALVGFPAFLFQLSPLDLARWAGAPAPLPPGGSLGRLAGIPLAAWVGALWIAGAVLLLGRFAWQVLIVRAVARAAEPARDTALQARLHACRTDLGLTTDVRLAWSGAVWSPVTFGWRRPVILLPREARGWPDAWLSASLSHEVAHIRRGDYLVLVLTGILRALYWPNPLVWKLMSIARVELERACDDAVLRAGVSQDQYARHLLDLAAQQRAAPASGALPMVRRSGFRVRMRAILDDAADRAPASRLVLVGAGALWFVLVSGLGAGGFWYCTAQSGAAPAAPAVVASGASNAGP